ncbi:MAG TPA: hypothetical protein VMC62_07065, partial [Longilinea sp.]|nr:hypothetical protein [Longilinea sp.]
MEEPSILDYLKEKLAFWRKSPTAPLDQEVTVQAETQESTNARIEPATESTGKPEKKPHPGLFGITWNAGRWPWKIILALGLALFAQSQLD